MSLFEVCLSEIHSQMHHLSIYRRANVCLYFCVSERGINIVGGRPKEDYFIQSRCMFPQVCDKGRYEWANGRTGSARIATSRRNLTRSLSGAHLRPPACNNSNIRCAHARYLATTSAQIFIYFLFHVYTYTASGKYLQGIAAEHEIGCWQKQTQKAHSRRYTQTPVSVWKNRRWKWKIFLYAVEEKG